MTPTQPPQRSSGNPARRAEIELTVKQQREQKRQEKLAEYQKQLSRRRRSRLTWWIVGSAAALAVVGVVVASFVFAPPAPRSYQAGNSTGLQIDGVQTFQNVSDHVQGTVDYPQTPPTGGPHNAVWLNCGIYTEPQVNENAVHALEHGAIWVTYDAAAVSADELATLKTFLPSSYVVLSPYVGLDSPIVLSGWNHQLKLDRADDPRIAQFFTEYWRSQNVPEPNATCSNGLDGPGKQ